MLTLTFFLIFISHFRDKDETDDIENKQTAAIREGKWGDGEGIKAYVFVFVLEYTLSCCQSTADQQQCCG